jgi:hypothetical protein
VRFTLCKLFLAVTMAGLACAAATFSTRPWASGIFIFTVVLYVVVAIRAIASTGQTRAMSIAFALVGGGYLLLTVCSAFAPIRGLLLTNQAIIEIGRTRQLSPPLVAATWTETDGTRHECQVIASELDKNVPQDAPNLRVTRLNNSYWPELSHPSTVLNPVIPEHAFVIVGHCVCSWLFASLAVWLAAALFARRPAAADSL